MANKTVEEILRTQFEVEDDPDCQREHFDEDVKRASRQLYEAMMEILRKVEQTGAHYFDGEKQRYSDNGEHCLEWIETELRAFYGITETEQEGK